MKQKVFIAVVAVAALACAGAFALVPKVPHRVSDKESAGARPAICQHTEHSPEEMEKVVKNSLEIQRRYKSEFFTFAGIRGYKCIFPFTDCCIVLFYRKNNYDDLYFEVCEIKNNEVGKHFSLLPCRIDKEDEVLNEMNVDLDYNNGIFLKQVSSFRVPDV